MFVPNHISRNNFFFFWFHVILIKIIFKELFTELSNKVYQIKILFLIGTSIFKRLMTQYDATLTCDFSINTVLEEILLMQNQLIGILLNKYNPFNLRINRKRFISRSVLSVSLFLVIINNISSVF